MRPQPGRVLIYEGGQQAAELVQIDAAGFQHLAWRRVVEHREQQVLDGDELVLLLPSFDKSHMEGNFQFLRNHSSVPISSPRWRFARANDGLTFKSPPWCTEADADVCVRCPALDLLLTRQLRECTFRTPPCLHDESAT